MLRSRRPSPHTALRAGLLLGAVAAFAVPLQAWGPVEHRVVARLAQERIGPRAQLRLRLLLGKGVKLQDHAVWADSILEERPETEPWHSITIPPTATALDLKRDCPIGDCVTVKLREFIGIARLAVKEKPELQEAIQYVLALAADLHQPLNAGYPPGTAGDGAAVTLRGKSISLHELWDSKLFADEDEESLTQRIRGRINSSAERKWRRGTLKDWTWETHLTAVRVAYGALPPGDPKELSGDYMERSRRSAEEQLAKAAVRLSAVLNDIWP